MGAKSSKPEYQLVDGKWYDIKTGKLRRHYYDAHGMIRAQLVDRIYNGSLEFERVMTNNQSRLDAKEPIFCPGDSVSSL